METPAIKSNATTSFIQVGAAVLLIYLCLRITAPFLSIVVWGMLIAIALYPLHLRLTSIVGDKQKLSSAIFVVAGMSCLAIPTWYLGSASIQEIQSLSSEFQSGSIKIPPPDPSVASWPVIGEELHLVWGNAASSLESTANQFQPQLESFGKWLLKFIASSAGGVIQFLLSILVAGAFLVNAQAGYKLSCSLAALVTGSHGKSLTDLSILTIRSVTKGVLGVAVIQAVLAGIGFLFIGVPGAGLWAGLVLILAIIQLPPLLVLGPIAAWVYSTSGTVPATIFAVYAFLISISDSFLKPIFLGKGLDVPMLVILFGAIGGAMAFGILGLFVGPVALSVSYTLLVAWMKMAEVEPDTN
ncbi:MAG: putative PurR-regulated permease PerM [Planctomycetota bacterium]|jgi:predicted PurR-regulated permease PerM